MSVNKKSSLSKRQFVKLTGAAAASSLWLPPLFAAQPGRKRNVIHGERQVTSLGYHNRRETEVHVSIADAGLVGQYPVTFERVPVLAEELPSLKKGTWKIDMQKKTMITVYSCGPTANGMTASQSGQGDISFLSISLISYNRKENGLLSPL